MVRQTSKGHIHRFEITCATKGMADEIRRLLAAHGYCVVGEMCELRDAFCRIEAEHPGGGPGLFARHRLEARLAGMVGQGY